MTKRIFKIVIFLALAIAMVGVRPSVQAVVAQGPKVILYNSNASDPAPRKFDDEIVKKVRKIAIERDTTLTGLVRDYLKHLAVEDAASGRRRRERAVAPRLRRSRW